MRKKPENKVLFGQVPILVPPVRTEVYSARRPRQPLDAPRRWQKAQNTNTKGTKYKNMSFVNVRTFVKFTYFQGSNHTNVILTTVQWWEKPSFKDLIDLIDGCVQLFIDFCVQAFTSNSALKVHQMVHTREKPFQVKIDNHLLEIFYDLFLSAWNVVQSLLLLEIFSIKMIIFSARNVVQSSPVTLIWGFTLMIDIFASQGNMMSLMVSFFIEPWCPWKINGLKRIYQIFPFSGRNTFSKIWNKDTSPFRFHCTQCPNKYNRPDQFRFSFKFQVQKPLWEIQIFTMSCFEIREVA